MRPLDRPFAVRTALAAAALGTLLAGCTNPSDDGSSREASPSADGTTGGVTPPAIDATGRGAPTTNPADLVQPAGAGRSADEHPLVATFAGMRGPRPATWQWQSPSGMRAGHWTVPGGSGGNFADLTAFVGIRGGTEANLTRWVGQFRAPEGGPVTPERWTVEIPGLGTSAAMIQLIGEFGGMSRDFRREQALLGAIFETSQGPVQLKFTGPQSVVLSNRTAFEAMVSGLRPAADYPLPTGDASGEAAGGAADDAPPAGATGDAGATMELDPATGWPLGWFSTSGEPQVRPARHLAVEGGAPPRVEVEAVIGGTMDLADLEGSIVVVDFWGTWCAPCMKAIPKLVEMQQRHADDGVVVIGIHSTLAGPRPMEQAVADLTIPYAVGRDVDRTSEQAWGVRQWPYYAIIGRDGLVRAAGLKSDFVDDAVAAILAEEQAAG